MYIEITMECGQTSVSSGGNNSGHSGINVIFPTILENIIGLFKIL